MKRAARARALTSVASGSLALLIAGLLTSCTPSAQEQVTGQDLAQQNQAQAGEAEDLLGLPPIAWEGGTEYWDQFEKAKAAGWEDDTFFPIGLWYNSISSNEEVQYDKSLGFNTYIGLDPSTPYSLFADNDVFWIGGPLNDSFNDKSTNWVGSFLGDEVDGRFDVPAGRKIMQEAADANAGTGRFGYTNYTKMVMEGWMDAADSENYVNAYSDVVSIDMYWYTVPFCSQRPLNHAYRFELTEQNCRTASSYGKTMDTLRQRDAADGKLQRLWQFVEIYNGGPGQDADFKSTITPAQLKGAVMNSLIHEARGIVYFNQSLSGDCIAGSVVRQSQVVENYCAKEQVAAAGEINAQIHELAPVLNSQSYAFDFGSGLDTMLKAKDGSAYIFAMLDDSLRTGERTFTMPESLRGKPVEVVDEDRTIQPDADGTFTDAFESESSYHIYRVQL